MKRLFIILFILPLIANAQTTTKVDEHEYYDIFTSILNPLKEPHIILESEPYSFDITPDSRDMKLLDTVFPKAEKEALLHQIDAARHFYWGPGMIYGAKVANKSDIENILNQGGDVGWEQFEKVFGCQEYWVYSVPLFSSDKNLCMVKYVEYCGPMCKTVFVYYYKKEGDKWKDIYHYRTVD